jgi:ankyrin repeat protein
LVLELWPESAAEKKRQFVRAADEGDAHTVESLLEQGIDPEHEDATFGKALGTACATANDSTHFHPLGYNAISTVQTLLRYGADVNGADWQGKPPLSYAARWGNVEIIGILLAAGADRDRRDPRGWTPLHYASMHGYPRAAEALIRAGTDVDAVDSELGWTPLMMACWGVHLDVVETLVAYGADINEIDDGTGIIKPQHCSITGPDVGETRYTYMGYHDRVLGGPPSDRMTALYIATIKDGFEIAPYLARRGGRVQRIGDETLPMSRDMRRVLVLIVGIFAQGTHPRLGKSSPVRTLVGFDFILRFIIEHSMPSWFIDERVQTLQELL